MNITSSAPQPSPRVWALKNTGQNGGTVGADVQAVEAWNMVESTDAPIIAVIDDGVDYTHPGLQGSLWTNPGEIPDNGIDDDGNGVVDDVHGYDAFHQTGAPMPGPTLKHGTHCAGTIGGKDEDGTQIGILPGARIMPIKVYDQYGQTNDEAIARGFEYATRMGARITSNSWNTMQYSPVIEKAMAASPALHVCAAGNYGFNNDVVGSYPANLNLENILSVAATDSNDRKADFSQWGPQNVDVAAPGVDIWSTVTGGGYQSKEGTSMATPLVAGLAGLLLSRYPNATNAELRDRLVYGSERSEDLVNVSVSGGRVNAPRSLEDDRIAPSSPGDARFSAHGFRGGELTWTTPGDDGPNTAPSLTEVRISDEPITKDNFQDTVLFARVSAEAAGETVKLDCPKVPEAVERTIYFGLQAIDNVGNRSALTSVPTTTPAALSEKIGAFESGAGFRADGNFEWKIDAKGRGYFTTENAYKTLAQVSTLQLPPLDLSGKKDSYLSFHRETNLFRGAQAAIEVSRDGETWQTLRQLGPRSSGWEEDGLDLSEFDGERLNLRLHLDSATAMSKGSLIRINQFRLLHGSSASLDREVDDAYGEELK